MTKNQIYNEKIITLDKINNLIEDLEFNYKQEKATDSTINQLLSAYEIKIKLLNNI